MYRIVFEPESLVFELKENNKYEYTDLNEWLHRIGELLEKRTDGCINDFMWHDGFWTYVLKNQWMHKENYQQQRLKWDAMRKHFLQMKNNCEGIDNECMMSPNRIYDTNAEDCIGKAITSAIKYDDNPIVFITKEPETLRSANSIINGEQINLQTFESYDEYESITQLNRDFVAELNELSNEKSIIIVGYDENFAKDKFDNIKFIDGRNSNVDFSCIKSYDIRLLWTNRMQHEVTRAIESKIAKNYVPIDFNGSNIEKFAEYILNELKKRSQNKESSL